MNKSKKDISKEIAQLPLLEELTSTGEGTGIEAESNEGIVAINSPFDPEKIDVITLGRTVDLLLTRLTEGELLLSPEFQRRANLWDETRKSRLIESLLLKIPLPSLYISEDAKGNYAVVDGLQRLCAIAHFVKPSALNKAVGSKLNPLRLTGLESLKEYKDLSYDELPRLLQRRINETELTMHIIRPGTPTEVKFNIFSRLNQGGLPLTAQEIRHAIYPGRWRNFIRLLAESKEFIEATEGKIKIERMDDMELCLRFVALINLKDAKRQNDQNLDIFLNQAVENVLTGWNDQDWDPIVHIFKSAMIASTKVFGKHAFRKYYGPNSRNPINRGLFEAESVLLAKLSTQEIDKLQRNSNLLLSKLGEEMIEDSQFERSLRYATGSGMASNTRIAKIQTIFDEILNA